MVEKNHNQSNSKHHRNTAVMFALLALIIIGAILVQKNNQKIKNFGSEKTVSSAYTLPSSKPKSIKISAINVDAPIINLGLNQDGTLQVPDVYSDVGWYANSPTPGELGPSVMVGHLDSAKAAAVFYKLKDLKQNDKIEVTREDGSTATFNVDALQTFAQDNFPTDKVYGPIGYAGLRLITCSGTYNKAEGHYSDNLVVYASLVKPN